MRRWGLLPVALCLAAGARAEPYAAALRAELPAGTWHLAASGQPAESAATRLGDAPVVLAAAQAPPRHGLTLSLLVRGVEGSLLTFGDGPGGLALGVVGGRLRLSIGAGTLEGPRLPERWQHVAVTWAPQTGATQLFLDGLPVARGTLKATALPALAPLRLGPGRGAVAGVAW
ncbi:MAG: hypothetical protein KC613_21395, partial [Myxococcales bacterium]|nr:hypothetical protein [Myxococcales bacterium]